MRGVTAASVTSTGATITWTTDEAADSQVEYGLTTAYGSQTTLNTNLVTSHSVPLSGLIASTLYHYLVKSRDASSNLATSGDSTFTTGTIIVTSGTLTTASAAGPPSSTVSIPISLTLNQGGTVDSLSLGVQINANSNAPALTGSLGFTKEAALPAPSLTDTSGGANQIGVSWLSGLALSGTTSLGTVQVVVPSAASNGQTYTIHITGVSATSGGNNVTLAAGGDTTLTVAATYLVGDVAPLLTDLNGDGDRDDAGEFGDGVFNNLDLIQALRAVVNLSRPPSCSDRYDAMDSVTADTAEARGGDGLLNNLDLIRTLRRVVNLDTSRPVRASRGISPCPPPAPARTPEFSPLSRRQGSGTESP